MTVLDCSTFYFLMDKWSKEDGDGQSSSGSKLTEGSTSTEVWLFSTTAKLCLQHSLDSAAQAVPILDSGNSKKYIKYLAVCLHLQYAWWGEKGWCLKQIEEDMSLERQLWRRFVTQKSFGFRKHCHQLPVKSKIHLKAAEKEQSGAAKHCCCNLLSSLDMNFL